MTKACFVAATCVALVAVAGCRQSGGATMDWVRVETDDLIIEYLLRVAGDAEGAVRQLDSALILDATSWRTYALAGQALEELRRMQAALRAYQTAIALGEAAPGRVLDLLKRRAAEIQKRRPGDTQPPKNH